MSDDPIGDWYERRRKEAAELAERLHLAQVRLCELLQQPGTQSKVRRQKEEVRRLRRRLEQARYVGD